MSAARAATRSSVGAARRDGDGDGEREDGAPSSADEVALVADDESASEVEAISRGGAPAPTRFKPVQLVSFPFLRGFKQTQLLIWVYYCVVGEAAA